jgi:hypothetical protein
MKESKKEIGETPEYLNKKELCKALNISPRTIQKELNKAIQETNGGVIKIGRVMRINFNRFIEWNNRGNFKDFNNRQSEGKWEGKGIKKNFTSGTASTGLTTMTKEDVAICEQLQQRIFKGR